MAKHLIQLSFSSWVIDNFVMYDTAVKLQKAGHEVHLFYCTGQPSVCWTNPCQKKIICRWCNLHRKKMHNSLPVGIKIHSFSDYYDQPLGEMVNTLTFKYNNLEEIKKIKYKEVQIGYGALSTYISQTRNLDPLIDQVFKNFFDAYLRAECLLVEILARALEKIKPDYVSLYNGRFFETRPAYDYAKKLGYTVRCYENIRPLGLEKGISSIYFENCLPHNIKFNKEFIENNWRDSTLTDSEKEKIGRSFFENRRGGKRAGDKVYTLNQNAGKLPENWDEKKRNIVIFNSSEDEFVAVGDEYSGLSLFPSQIVGLKKILELFKEQKDFYFYLRIHPNLKGIKYKYHLDLYKLEEQYNNIKVIPPESKISSYTLLDAAEKIIVFGSTIGVEAAYWGKSVILLAETFYSYLDLCYLPSSIESLQEMILMEPQAKNSLSATKYGFFVMKDKRGEPITEFDIGAKVIRKKYFFFKYRPIRYSTVYLAIIKIFLIVLNKIYPQRKNAIPTKENK